MLVSILKKTIEWNWAILSTDIAILLLLISVAATKRWKLKLNISNIKPFDVEFRYVVHFKTVEVHFNATFGEYQTLIYRYFSKIL